MKLQKSLVISLIAFAVFSLALTPTAKAHGGLSPQQHQQRLEQRLNKAVEKGKLTEEQKNKILEKFKENLQWRKSLQGMTPEQRHEAIKQHREEMKKWAKENGIPKPPKGFFHRPKLHFSNED